jgi:hypothetical protein
MTTKSKSKSKSKSKNATKEHWSERVPAAATPFDEPYKRKELLARVAGAVAAGLVTTPSPSIASPSGMATAAVDIAEEILKKAGFAPIESAEVFSPSTEDAVGAAS